MENRLDELASIVEWVDDLALEPKWRLVPWHTTPVDGRTEIGGARHLDTLRLRLAGCMVRLADWATHDVLARGQVRAAFFTGDEGQKRRTQDIVEFHDDPACRVLFTTDAGGVGLNLQRAASACINIEMPWNPAVIEQRIGRMIARPDRALRVSDRGPRAGVVVDAKVTIAPNVIEVNARKPALRA